jgi:hypothetical protein
MRTINSTIQAIICLLLSLSASVVLADSNLVSSHTKTWTESNAANSGIMLGRKLLVVDHFTLPKDTILTGNMLLIANSVDLQGDVTGKVRIVAATVKVAGHVPGRLYIIADHIEVQPTAVIDGRLKYIASSLKQADQAIVDGKLQPWPDQRINSRLHTLAQGFPWVLYTCLVLLGLISILSMQRFSSRLVIKVKQRPWMSLITGVALVFLTPWVILTAILSIVGIPLSILLLGFYVLSLSLAYVYAAWLIGRSMLSIFIKQQGTHGFFTQLIALILGLFLLYLIGMLPILGKLVKFVALFIGLGGIALTLMSPRDAVLVTTERSR